MTEKYLKENYPFVASARFYPNSNAFKVWFDNGTKRIFFDIIHFKNYVEEHKKELLEIRECRKRRQVKKCEQCLRYEECFPKKKKG